MIKECIIWMNNLKFYLIIYDLSEWFNFVNLYERYVFNGVWVVFNHFLLIDATDIDVRLIAITIEFDFPFHFSRIIPFTSQSLLAITII